MSQTGKAPARAFLPGVVFSALAGILMFASGCTANAQVTSERVQPTTGGSETGRVPSSAAHGPAIWRTLRFGDSSADAKKKVSELPFGTPVSVEWLERPKEWKPEPEHIRVDTLVAKYSRSLFPELSRLGRLRAPNGDADLARPHITVQVFKGSVFEFTVSTQFAAEERESNADVARSVADGLKNEYGKVLPNLVCSDTSQAPSYSNAGRTRRVLISADTSLRCTFDGGEFEAGAAYFNVTDPAISISMTFTSQAGAELKKKRDEWAAAEQERRRRYEAAREVEFEVEFEPKASTDDDRIQLRTDFDTTYRAACKRVQPDRYACSWREINKKTKVAAPHPTLSGIYVFDKNSYKQFVLAKKMPPSPDFDGVWVAFHLDNFSGLGGTRDTYTAAVRFLRGDSVSMQIWLTGVGIRPEMPTDSPKRD